MKTIAILSMLHESAEISSASRRFRKDPVIHWTIRRLTQSTKLNGIVVPVWDDQIALLEGLAEPVQLHRCGARRAIPQLQAITTAQKWADGWRGGLLATCAFDRGYVGEVVKAIVDAQEADAAVIVDPAAGLVDHEIIDQMITTAETGARDYYFTQTPPGLGGVLLKCEMIDRLVTARTHPGRVVHYLPDAPVLDPVTSDACVQLPLVVSRSTGRFLMDSTRQIQRISEVTLPLNGSLITTRASGIAERFKSLDHVDELPRELVVELTTKRNTKPIFSPLAHHVVDRNELSLEHFEKILSQIASQDDLRLTLSGVGDPLLHSQINEILPRLANVPAVSIETDLLDVSDQTIDHVLKSGVDVISIHLPAMLQTTYQQVMGADRMKEVLENIRRLMTRRLQLGLSTPIVVPTFMKTPINLDEMEQWYDTWLSAVQNASIQGPSTFSGRVPNCSVAEMSPPVRSGCRRINSRITILSDGRFAQCEIDFSGDNSIGSIDTITIQDVWARSMQSLRETHRSGIALPVICEGCKDWFRP